LESHRNTHFFKIQFDEIIRISIVTTLITIGYYVTTALASPELIVFANAFFDQIYDGFL